MKTWIVITYSPEGRQIDLEILDSCPTWNWPEANENGLYQRVYTGNVNGGDSIEVQYIPTWDEKLKNTVLRLLQSEGPTKEISKGAIEGYIAQYAEGDIPKAIDGLLDNLNDMAKEDALETLVGLLADSYKILDNFRRSF